MQGGIKYIITKNYGHMSCCSEQGPRCWTSVVDVGCCCCCPRCPSRCPLPHCLFLAVLALLSSSSSSPSSLSFSCFVVVTDPGRPVIVVVDARHPLCPCPCLIGVLSFAPCCSRFAVLIILSSFPHCPFPCPGPSLPSASLWPLLPPREQLQAGGAVVW